MFPGSSCHFQSLFLSELLTSSPSSHTDTGPTCLLYFLQALELHGGEQWGGNSCAEPVFPIASTKPLQELPRQGPLLHLRPIFKRVSSTYMVLAYADPQATEASKAQCLPLRDAAYLGNSGTGEDLCPSQQQMEDRALGRLRGAHSASRKGNPLEGVAVEPNRDSQGVVIVVA